jgi:hypothetical protein
VGVLALIGLGFPMETVVVAPGRVIPSDRVKSIQHLEGGIVSNVLVKEGENGEGRASHWSRSTWAAAASTLKNSQPATRPRRPRACASWPRAGASR